MHFNINIWISADVHIRNIKILITKLNETKWQGIEILLSCGMDKDLFGKSVNILKDMRH